MSYYTTSRLSEHLEMTPEGYLLCRAVPIARTGALEYLPEEVPPEIAADASGPTILVYRTPEELFSSETIASYEGKDVTITHPDDFLTAENWRELACGHAQAVRQGEGEESDLLLADLLIKDKDTISLILPQDGGEPELREVSCGYDADYELVAPGIGKQTNIIGNHIALVPHGRCGSRCAIKDKEIDMPKKSKAKGFWDSIFSDEKVKKAMADAAEEQKATGEEENPEQQAVTDDADIGEKLDELLIIARSLLEALKPKDEAPAKDGDPAADEEKTGDEDPAKDGEPAKDAEPDGEQTGKTGDKRSADAATIARAGKLAPGMRFRVGDADTVVKRAALHAAMSDSAVAELVTTCLGGTALSSASGASLDAAFAAAASFAGARNNDRTGKALAWAKDQAADAAGPTTPAQINEINKKYRTSSGKE